MSDKLRLFLDQMIQLKVAELLSQNSYDVVRASEVGHERADDKQILNKAIKENRILVTLDEHFGDWVVLPLTKHPGVIRIKVHPTTANNISSILLPFLKNLFPEQIRNHLVILAENKEKWICTQY